MKHIPPVGSQKLLDVAIRAKTYVSASGQSHLVLADVAFALEQGLVGAIVGPSGCGKTTLLRMISGLDRDFDGTIKLPAAGKLAFVFQEPRLLPWRSVDDNVRIAAPAIDEQELASLFEALGLSLHRKHFPGELSLGLARRVALVRALAVQPDLLLLDEPFASLDAAMSERLLEQLTDLVEARRVTTLLVTHDLDTAMRLADKILVLSARPARLTAEIAVTEPRRKLTAFVMEALALQLAQVQKAATE